MENNTPLILTIAVNRGDRNASIAQSQLTPGKEADELQLLLDTINQVVPMLQRAVVEAKVRELTATKAGEQ